MNSCLMCRKVEHVMLWFLGYCLDMDSRLSRHWHRRSLVWMMLIFCDTEHSMSDTCMALSDILSGTSMKIIWTPANVTEFGA